MNRPNYVYVASSWRNAMQSAVVQVLRAAGVDCYDFRNPAPGVSGFAWSEIDPDWLNWTPEQYIAALDHPIAQEGYRRDFEAMQRADAFVLVLPCGRSAHLELGWAAGAGKRTAILTGPGEEPELMAKMVDHIAPSVHDLLGWLGVEDQAHCRECGCTDDHACEGGCWWIEADLCSACGQKAAMTG